MKPPACHPIQRHLASAVFAIAGILLISGCTSTTDAAFATAKNLFPKWNQAAPAPADPELRYMRIFANGQNALLVLGEIDRDPLGDIESWYSGQAEVIKFQNGRIVGTGGLATNWVGVNIIPLHNGGYQRIRDVMPGYRFGLMETVAVQKLPAIPSEIKAVAGFNWQRLTTLQWQEEAPQPSLSSSVLPRNLIGYEQRPDGQQRAAAGFQCIDDGICIQWERL